MMKQIQSLPRQQGGEGDARRIGAARDYQGNPSAMRWLHVLPDEANVVNWMARVYNSIAIPLTHWDPIAFTRQRYPASSHLPGQGCRNVACHSMATLAGGCVTQSECPGCNWTISLQFA